MYSENGFLGKIKSKIPSWVYSGSELRENSFSIYYKPYATLNIACEEDYSTEYIASSGKQMGSLSDTYQLIYVTALVASILLAGLILLMPNSNKLNIDIDHVLVVTVFGVIVQVALVLILSRLRYQMSNIDIDMFEYLRDNKCTDGALGRGVDVIAESYS